jgi:hypothetical protein
MYNVLVDDDKITEQLFKAKEVTDANQTRYPGSFYEEGVVAALTWIFGENPYPPVDEE